MNAWARTRFERVTHGHVVASARHVRTFQLSLANMVFALGFIVSSFHAACRAQAPLGSNQYPTPLYFSAMIPYNVGNYRDAVKAFNSAALGGRRSTQGLWIDGICYHTMLGETYFQQGDLAKSLVQHELALQLAITYRGWQKQLQLDMAVTPVLVPIRVPWGPTARNTVPGNFEILQQFSRENDTVVTQNAILPNAKLISVNAVEIMRCIAVSVQRRQEILGPLAREMPFTNEITKELSARYFANNHWASALAGVQAGVAHSAAGDFDEAEMTLKQSLVVMGQLDHPLTGLALVELARLALRKQRTEEAQRYAFEATLVGAQFAQPDVIEAGFRIASQLHIRSGAAGIFPPLTNAIAWARSNGFVRLAVSLSLMAAENASAQQRHREAMVFVTQAKSAIARTDMRMSPLAGWLNYQMALVNFQSGKIPAGKETLTLANKLQRAGSTRFFQIALTEKNYESKAFSPRTASVLLAELLREPNDDDWRYDPRETLSFDMAPLVEHYERWLEICVVNRDTEAILRVSEMLRRQKFYESLEMGGRLLNFRWILECPEVALGERARQHRQNLLAKMPQWSELAQKMSVARAELLKQPLAPESGENRKPYESAAARVERLAEDQEQLLWEVALRAEPAERIFPPLLAHDDIMAKLKPKQAALVIVQTPRVSQAILLTAEKKFRVWNLKGTGTLRATLTNLMREIGNLDSNQVMPAERLANEDWKLAATSLFTPFAEGITAEELKSIEEWVIVPDGIYWYLPFEMLLVPQDGGVKPFMDVARIRYAPTAGLAVGDARPTQPTGPRFIVQGRLFSRETDAILSATAAQLHEDNPASAIVRKRLPASTGIVGTTWHELVVLDDIEVADKDPLDFSPAQLDQGKPGSSLGEWLGLPWGGPDVMVLPGYHTASENALKGKSTGDEVFIATCGILATGTRTVLLSRWRTGGRTSLDLVREFLRELVEKSPAESWQRSQQVCRSAQLEATSEPRLKDLKPGEVPKADHPFFWAGYLLISP